jgi:SAM-dependent methyltransferase
MEALSGDRAADLLAQSRAYYWYHCIELQDGVITDGDYQMLDYLGNYKFPDSMAGMHVLDVGRASGFFAFEFERRGAAVTATEINSFLDWDFVGGAAERAKRRTAIADIDAYTRHHITGAFHFAHATRQSAVKPVTATIYDLSLDLLQASRPFDLVFAGSVTSHLRDPMRGLARLREVTAEGGTCVVAAPYIGLDEGLAQLAMVAGDPDRRSWWVMNKRCLTDMLLNVGFSSARIVSQFNLALKRKIDGVGTFTHIVAHATA